MALFQACLLMYLCVIIETITTSNGEAPTNSRIKPNIFTPKSILRLEYGLLYEHIGQLYQGLQWYYLVIGIPLPTEKDIPDAYTDISLKCDYCTCEDNNQSPVWDLMQICVDFFPLIIKKSSVLKKMQQQLKKKIHSDMPALLPNPVVNFHMQTPGQEHISPYAKVDEVVHLKDQNMTKCYRNWECLKCNGILYYKLSLKYYKSSPLLVPWLQHVGKHTPLSLLTP